MIKRIHTTITPDDYDFLKKKNIKIATIIKDFCKENKDDTINYQKKQIKEIREQKDIYEKKISNYQTILKKLGEEIEKQFGEQAIKDIYEKI